MKRASKFAFSANWKLLLQDMQINVELALAHANLPADMLNQDKVILTPTQYFQLWHGIEKAAGEREVALLLAEHFSAEVFDPPLFVSFCSPDFATAARRLQHYKPLIGPMILDITEQTDRLLLEIGCYGHQGLLPRALATSELVFFTELIRTATRENIIPVQIGLPEVPVKQAAYEAYFGCPVTKTDIPTISFSLEDAYQPFVTANSMMWEFFEGQLNQKLADLDAQASTSERVKAVLLEALPAGESSIEHVAGKLALSKRTLQRKLTQENESYQSVLIAVRSQLADHYLRNSALSLGEISFLLGFQESNSFIRAYSHWHGRSPGQVREQHH